MRLQFQKGGFREVKQKPEVLRGIDVEEEERGGKDEGRRVTDVCLWDSCTSSINEPSLLLEAHPTLQAIKGTAVTMTPISAYLSHFEIPSQHRHCVTMA